MCVIVVLEGTSKTMLALDAAVPLDAAAHVIDSRVYEPPLISLDPESFGSALCRDA
jgi:hypothetical protein